MNSINLKVFQNNEINAKDPILLFQEGLHKIYWIGIDNESAFRCNVYMIQNHDEYLIVDPGSREFYKKVKSNISKIIDPKKVTGLILCHQDPDVCASIIDWIDFNTNISIISSARTNILLPHYGISDYNFYDINETLEYNFKSGDTLKFIEAPFLHFPGAFATLDLISNFLFSGDIWAALDTEWKLVVDDFSKHIVNMDLFHLDYMASNIAARGFVNRLLDKDIDAILPQHGSIIEKENVENALNYLQELQCGLDIIYPNISR